MIIDSHVHFGKSLGFTMTKKDVLCAMEKYGVSKIIVSNAVAVEFNEKHEPLLEKENTLMLDVAKETIDFAKDNPDSVYAAIWVKPHTELLTGKFEYLLKIHLKYVKALKFHPFYSALSFDNPLTEPYIELAESLDLPVIVHTASDEFSLCKNVYKMAKKYPHVRFVMAHLGLGTDNSEAIDFCAELPNLFGDTAWVPAEKAEEFVKKAGSKKLMFGSDMPIDGIDTYAKNRNGERSMYQDYFENLEKSIGTNDFENIMFKNAQQFYKL